MRKTKAKTALQKRRARAKAKSRQQEKERESWVQDRLDWVNISDRHDHDFDDEPGDEVPLDFPNRNEPIEKESQTRSHEANVSIENETKDSIKEQLLHDFSIISWNVLADSYCSRSSHKNLPRVFQGRVFNRSQRQHQVRQMLALFNEKLSPDIIALQEVDAPLEGKDFLNAYWINKQNRSYAIGRGNINQVKSIRTNCLVTFEFPVYCCTST